MPYESTDFADLSVPGKALAIVLRVTQGIAIATLWAVPLWGLAIGAFTFIAAETLYRVLVERPAKRWRKR